jgi:hypothetical protein
VYIHLEQLFEAVPGSALLTAAAAVQSAWHCQLIVRDSSRALCGWKKAWHTVCQAVTKRPGRAAGGWGVPTSIAYTHLVVMGLLIVSSACCRMRGKCLLNLGG